MDKALHIPIERIDFNISNTIPILQRKQTGSFYTSNELTTIMMNELIENMPIEKKLHLYDLKFLEPCVGEGSFVFAYLAAASNLGFTKKQYIKMFENLYVCDINKNALQIYKNRLSKTAMDYFDIYLDDSYFSNHIGGGLLFNLESNKPYYIPIEDIFGTRFTRGFDIVSTNPPYKNLKAERVHYPSVEMYNNDKERYSIIKNQASNYLSYSLNKVNNIYRFFVEEIIEKYSTKDGIISLLIPSSILTDKTCEQLRTRILSIGSILSIKMISEDSRYVDAHQALCALLIQKNIKTKKIEIYQNYGSQNSKKIIIDTDKSIDVNRGNSILALEPSEYRKLQKIKKFPVIKDLPFIVNMRGELDLSSNKSSIITKKTRYSLVRGRNISYYRLTNHPSNDYVTQEFVSKCPKKFYIQNERLICQQIANMSKERRLTFAIAPKNVVLGNSCNFITIKPNNYEIDIYFLLGILNSGILNWFFKLQSSNNHINNYEIDNFPIPISYNKKNEISELVREYLKDQSRNLLLDRIEELVCSAYDINGNRKNYDTSFLADTTNFEKKVLRKISEKQEKINNMEVLNHTTFKLSDLDLEMVIAIPQGGNWKNIPAKTVAKSKRLVRITETGGRTTLYGRIDYDKPSYTITTYFNRPGNGTYIHPIHNRVLSVREAARFQSFPDNYYFLGNKKQLLNLVGNALPPFFTYQIAKETINKMNCKYSIDLFCGAGGMTLGFKQAGIKSILSTDIEETACLTLKINNPEIPVLCGDITKNDTKKKIIEYANKEDIDIICGGPPCQGFSMAGHRLSDDPRNQLFKDFITIVEYIKPKVVVFENVEGLLTFEGGTTYKVIHDLFNETGYYTEGKLLQTNLYGIPQKRKRVIIICVRKDLKILPVNLFPLPITKDEPSQITARMAISDLENIECGDNVKYNNSEISDYVAMLKGDITIDDFFNYLSKKSVIKTTSVPIQKLLF